MRVWHVAMREFLATVSTKGFVFGAVLFPLVIAGMIPVILYLVNTAQPSIAGTVTLIDRSGVVHVSPESINAPAAIPELEAAAKLPGISKETMASAQPTSELSLEVLDASTDLGLLKASLAAEGLSPAARRVTLIVVPRGAVVQETHEKGEEDDGSANVAGPFAAYEMFVSPVLDPQIQQRIRIAVEAAIIDARVRSDVRLLAAQLDTDAILALTSRPHGKVRVITSEGERESFEIGAFVIPLVFIMLIWISVFTAGQFLLYSTIEEKSSRIMEVLLSAVTPKQLLLGKIVGQLGVGVVILSVYTLLSFGALLALAATHLVALSDVLLLLVYFHLAFFSIATLLAAAGSAVSDIKEANALVGPIMAVLVLPMLLWMPISRAPNSTFAHVLSFTPLLNPFVMVVRLAGAEPVPVWQIGVSIAIGIVTCVVMIWISAKIFRVGSLMYAKPPNLRTLWRWLRMS